MTACEDIAGTSKDKNSHYTIKCFVGRLHRYLNDPIFRHGYTKNGFIKTPECLEYYFHETNVQHPPFNQLKPGEVVSFIEVQASDTLQAGHVSENGKFAQEIE